MDEECKWFYDVMVSGFVDEVKKMKEDVEALRNAARGEMTSEEDGE